MKDIIKRVLREEVDERLKRVIKNKLSKDLSHVEIILHTDGSIWFIDRDEKYWYLEFDKDGCLWWRGEFFINFFKLFSMERSEYEPLIVEWVEEVLNRKLYSTIRFDDTQVPEVEEVLNRKVNSTLRYSMEMIPKVEDILNQNKLSK